MIGVGTQMASSWRSSNLVPAHVEVIPANFGTAGSLADYRRRRTDVVLSPPDPRMRRWNGLIPVVWRLRVADVAKTNAVAARATKKAGKSVNFTQVRTASLNKNGASS